MTTNIIELVATSFFYSTPLPTNFFPAKIINFSIVISFERKYFNITLKPGMIFTIEPMINMGDWRLHIDKQNGWTAITDDGSLSAQWEHTIGITENGCIIFTK